MATRSQKSVIEELSLLAEALAKHFPNTPFIEESKTYSGPEVIAQVQAILGSAQAVSNARGTLADAIRDDRVMQANNAQFLRHLRSMLRGAYSGNSSTLAEFGLEPVKTRPPPTNDELLLRVAKSLATRKKRRTMGKRQKAAIKGNVTGVVITPVEGPARKK